MKYLITFVTVFRKHIHYKAALHKLKNIFHVFMLSLAKFKCNFLTFLEICV